MKKLFVLFLLGAMFSAFFLISLRSSKAQESIDRSASGGTLIEKFLTEGEQSKRIRPVAQSVENARAAGVHFEGRNLFQADSHRVTEDAQLREALSDGLTFELDSDAIKQILKNDTNFMTLQVPTENGSAVELQLVKTNIFSNGFSVKTSQPTAEVNAKQWGVHYQGIVKGDTQSIAAISVFENEIAGFFYNEARGNNVLGKLGGVNPGNRHVVYAEKDLRAKPDRYCAVKDEPQPSLPISVLQSPESIQTTCVRMYLEANYDIFLNKGSVVNAVAYVSAMFNQSATLYRNDGVSLSISEMFVWNSPSPYVNTTSSSAILTQFRTTRTSFNGNLAHLLTLANYGGIAYLNVVCNPSFRYGITGISASFQTVPAYSWSVDAFTHEVGHNLGSSHTHACVWNGNSTAIDSCGPASGYDYEGACSGAPLPASGQGTIMSYCHLNIGKNLALGFGEQPKAVIQNRVASGTCLTDCGSATTTQFTTGGYTVSEAAGVATVFISRQGTAAGVTVNYATANGTATAGEDYTAVSGTMTFAAGETVKGFSIPITDDTAFEPAETINVNLSSPTGGITLGTPSASAVSITNNDTQVFNRMFDYDGDGKADVSIYRPGAASLWYVQNSATGGLAINQFGTTGDLSVPADYDGDGKTDVAIFRPSNGAWYWLRSSNGQVGGSQFGGSGDIPVPADYDGDGKADIAIFRAGTWWIYRSLDNNVTANVFGISGDRPTLGDYDGDRKADLAVFRPSSGVWYHLNSTNGAFVALTFGAATDKAVPADYDGDGKTDVAIYRPSTGNWFYVNSGNGSVGGNTFGVAEDLPVPADYDGDGKADIAVFRPSQGLWYLLRTTAGLGGQQFGTAGDVPTPNSFVQ